MKYNKKTVVGFILVITLIFSSCGNEEVKENQKNQTDLSQPSYSEKAQNAIKSETVYINLDSSGNVEKILVSDRLSVEKSGVYVDDVSNLENIKNIKSEIAPDTSSGTLRWHMQSTELYYSGTTDSEPPISYEINYFLNGEKISAQEISGKNGEIKIQIRIKNNAIRNVTVDGKAYSVSLPVVVAGGMILSASIFKNINLENAQSFSDGSKHLVAFASIPALNESLGLKSENGITDAITADEITVTATASNFSLENMYFAVIPLASLNYNIELPDSASEINNAINSINGLKKAFDEIDPNRIIFSLLSDESKVNSLLTALNEASNLYESNRYLIELADKYSTPENVKLLQTLIETLNSPEAKAMLSVISTPEVQSFISDLPAFIEAFENIKPLLEEIHKDLSDSEVQNEIANLPETADRLSNISKIFSENQKEINSILSMLDGNGVHSLELLFKNINPDDFSFGEYGELIENSDLTFALVEEWLKYGREYRLFTDAADDMSTSLIFIYKTSSIK